MNTTPTTQLDEIRATILVMGMAYLMDAGPKTIEWLEQHLREVQS